MRGRQGFFLASRVGLRLRLCSPVWDAILSLVHNSCGYVEKGAYMSLASSIALIAVLAVVVGSLPGIVFVFTYAPSFKWRALKAARRQVAARSSMLNRR